MHYQFIYPNSTRHNQVYDVTFRNGEVVLDPVNCSGTPMIIYPEKAWRKFLSQGHYIMTVEQTIKNEKRKRSFWNGVAYYSALLSKTIFTRQGYEVDYRVNGEGVRDFRRIAMHDLEQRMRLAVHEQRFLDAARFRDAIAERQQLSDNEVNIEF